MNEVSYPNPRSIKDGNYNFLKYNNFVFEISIPQHCF